MILTTDEEGVRTLTLNRPEKLNAFNDAQFDALADAVNEAGTDDTVKVIVLTGAGRAFSAGADLSGDRFGKNIRYGFPGCVDVMSNAILGFDQVVSGLQDPRLYVDAVQPKVYLPQHGAGNRCNPCATCS